MRAGRRRVKRLSEIETEFVVGEAKYAEVAT
jgi:hypothetical protein